MAMIRKSRLLTKLLSSTALIILPCGNIFAQTMVDVGDLSSPIISGDGNVIIGSAPGVGQDGIGSSSAQAYQHKNNILSQLGTTYQNSYPYGISADGSTIIGTGADGENNAFIYTNSGGIHNFLAGPPDAHATAISANGNVVAGDVFIDPGGFSAWRYQLFKYDVGGSVTYPQSTGGYSSTTSISPIYLGQYSNSSGYPGFDPNAIGSLTKPLLSLSSDGSIIAGTYYYSDYHVSAFMFDNSGSGTLTSIGNLYSNTDNYNSYTMAISGDGSTVVGWSNYNVGYDDQAFKYARTSGLVGLGFLGTGDQSYANAVSNNGSIIVGTSRISNENTNMHAFKYTEESGMQDLGTLGGTNSYAYDVSSDGNVIVGSSDIPGDTASHAFAFYNGTIQDLGTLGGTNSYAYSVSDDGSVITGISQITGDSAYHTFLYRLKLISITNTQAAVATTASNTYSYMDLANAKQNAMANYDCSSFGDNKTCLAVGGHYVQVEDKFTELNGSIMAAYKITDNIRLGAFVDEGGLSNNPSGFKEVNSNPSIGSFIGYSQYEDEIGIQAKIISSYNKNKVQITRQTLAYSEAGTGDSNITANMISTNIGYGFKVSEQSTITPFIGLRKTKVSRDAYTESSDNISFPISYNKYSQKLTTASLGSKINHMISDKVNIHFSAAIEKDIDSEFDNFSYSIPYHGSSTYTLEDSSKYDCRGSGQAGIVYDISKNQKISSDVIVQSQVNSKSNLSVTGIIFYKIGL